MWKPILIVLLFSPILYSQNYFVGVSETTTHQNGILKSQTVLVPEVYNHDKTLNTPFYNNPPFNINNNTTTRWSYTDPASIGYHCAVSSNGNYNVTGWDLNSERVSLYGNLNSVPYWEFYSNPLVSNNYVAISDTGGVIAVGSHKNIYLFHNSSNVPFFNFDLTTLPDTGVAGPVDITKDGSFLVGCAYRYDSSTIFGFNSGSNVPVWSFKVVPSTGAARIYGIKLSGNDSLLIANSYGVFYILNTFTGQLIYEGLINPVSSSGTQAVQGINGDGSIIATVNYRGYIRVFQRSGSTYNLLWQHQEPPGTYYNWMYSVDITYNGDFIACGTLNFLTSSSWDGKIKVFKTSTGSTPVWTYAGCGDAVNSVSFSKSGNILAASSWGAFNHSTDDFYLFKTYLGNVPIFTINTPGSFFWCNTSSDGRTVVTSGKAVHARQMGSGGLLYNINVDTNDIPVAVGNNQNLSISKYKLWQNYPNPFNPETIIKYEISEIGHVTLKVYNSLGKTITTLINKIQNKGSYEVKFNGANLTNGIYFYQLETKSGLLTKKMILLK